MDKVIDNLLKRLCQDCMLLGITWHIFVKATQEMYLNVGDNGFGALVYSLCVDINTQQQSERLFQFYQYAKCKFKQTGGDWLSVEFISIYNKQYIIFNLSQRARICSDYYSWPFIVYH